MIAQIVMIREFGVTIMVPFGAVQKFDLQMRGQRKNLLRNLQIPLQLAVFQTIGYRLTYLSTNHALSAE